MSKELDNALGGYKPNGKPSKGTGHHLGVNVDSDTHKRLHAYLTTNHTTISQVVRDALDNYLPPSKTP